MGANCAKPLVAPSHREFSDTSESHIYQHSIKPSNSEYLFQIALRNVCLSSYQDQLYEIVFEFDKNSRLLFSLSEMVSNGKLKIWNSEKKCEVKMNEQTLMSEKLRISVYWRNEEKMEVLKLKFGQLCRGPIHHDHLLPELKSRIIFDIQINQLVDLNITCTDFKFHPFPGKLQKMKISSDLIYSSKKTDYLDMKPRPMLQALVMTYKIFSHELKQSTLRIRIWDPDPNTPDIHAQIYIPYQKILNCCDSYKTQRKNNSNFMKRSLVFKEKLKKEKQINYCIPEVLDQLNSPLINNYVEFRLSWQVTEPFVDQLEGVILSEKGINTVSPYMLKGEGGSSVFSKPQNHQLNYGELKKLLKQLKELKSNKNNAREQKKILQKTYKSLTQSTPFNFDDDIETLSYQFLLIDLLEEISNLIEEGEYLINENIWKIFNVIIHRAELSIRYLHAIDNLKDKKKIGIKFYKFLCSTLIIIVRSTGIGLEINELKYSQKFIAYSYFRFPWLQNHFMRQISKSTDPSLSIDRLAEIGVGGIIKSPSKNMVFDWQGNFYNFIRKEPEYLQAQEKLIQIIESFPHWPDMLFNHDDQQLYFGGLSELLNEAQITLNYQGKILWQYFPAYEKLIGRFQAEMNNNQPGFTIHFQEFAIKIMRNQKLLNNFLKFLFSKTFLFQTYSVMRCIEIIRIIFQMLTVKSQGKLPTNFNCNLFYRGIVSILQTNHSHLVIKTLNVLFLYYEILPLQCQNNIDGFLLSTIFYHLFLHWYYLTRKMFMCFVRKHLAPKYQKLENSVKKFNTELSLNDEDYEEKFKETFKVLYDKQKELKEARKLKLKSYHSKMNNEYFMRMKEKLAKIKKEKKCKSKELDERNFFNRSKESLRGSLHNPIFFQKHSSFMDETENRPRKWSSQIVHNTFEIPEGSEHYLEQALKEYEDLLGSEQQLNYQVESIMSNFSKKRKIDEKE